MEKLKGTIGENVKNSVKIEKSTISDCAKFNFDIKIIEFKGEVCKSGILDVNVKVAGFQMAHLKIDLSKGEYCNTVSVGIEEVKYCFYLKGSCLYTKGYVDGWLHDKQKWDEKIICF